MDIDDCPHLSGFAACEEHPRVRAVVVHEGLPWCPDCAVTFSACAEHPDHPAGTDDEGMPICQLCTLADSGAREAMALSRPRRRAA